MIYRPDDCIAPTLCTALRRLSQPSVTMSALDKKSRAHDHDDHDNRRQDRVREVVIDGLAVLKIVKHCNENLPTMVAGSLLGLDVDGVLDVTYAYPFPAAKSGEADGSGRAPAAVPGATPTSVRRAHREFATACRIR